MPQMLCLRAPSVALGVVLVFGLSARPSAQDPGRRSAPPAAKAPAATGELEIDVGLVLKNGNVLHVLRTEFWLVRRSVSAILMENDPEGFSHYKDGLGSDEDLEVNTLCSVLHSPRFVQALRDTQPRRFEAVMAAVPVIRRNTVETVQTDFTGKATFTAPAGRYWVFGCYSQDPNEDAWNVPVVMAAGGKKSFILDQNNATTR